MVGDQKSIKRGKEVINELLNLAAPATTDTAAAQPIKGTVKSIKTTPKTKKLPPLPSEPKPVGQVSRFSLLVNNDDDDEEEDECEESSDEVIKQVTAPPAPTPPVPNNNNNNDSSILSPLHFPTVSKVTKV